LRLRSLLSPLQVREFRLIWTAEIFSLVGDWATRLALAVVVLERTGSATIASLVVGVSLFAWLGPGQLLSQLADVYSRRTVMIVSDLLRAAVFVGLAFPVPTWMLLVGAGVAGLATPPFATAQSAIIRDLVPSDRYGAAMSLSGMTMDAGVVLGYAVGGALLALTSPQGALVLNAGTFVLSAVLISRLPKTPAPQRAASQGGRAPSPLRGGLAVVFRQPIVRLAAGVAILASGSGVAIESLVVVYNGRDLQGPQWTPGAVLAATYGISLVVTACLPHKGTRQQLVRAAGLTCGFAGAIVVVGFLSGSHAGAVIAFVAAGAFFAVLAPANVVVGPLLPSAVRASSFGVLWGVLVIMQSSGAATAGVLADHVSTSLAGALVCFPALAAAAWALLARSPAGLSDDVEAPLAVPGPAPVASPAAVPPTAPVVQPALAQVAYRPAPARLIELNDRNGNGSTPRGRHSMPARVEEYSGGI
jgi:MFS family permease